MAISNVRNTCGEILDTDKCKAMNEKFNNPQVTGVQGRGNVALVSKIGTTINFGILKVLRVLSNKVTLLQKKVNVCNIVNKSKDLLKCLQQQFRPFGFLPIINLCNFGEEISFIQNVVYTWENLYPIQTHYRMLESGKYNFLGCRIQVP